MEVVTTRSSLVVVILCIFLAAGTASATSPLPPIEKSVSISNMDIAVTRGELIEKPPTIPERCLPRNLGLCVGPFTPDVNANWGTTGVRVIVTDTNATAGHDPHHHFEYGPYSVPTILFDDVRVCNSTCVLPNPAYLYANATVTVIFYVGGSEFYRYSYGTHEQFAPTGLPIPSTWSCDPYHEWCLHTD